MCLFPQFRACSGAKESKVTLSGPSVIDVEPASTWRAASTVTRHFATGLLFRYIETCVKSLASESSAFMYVYV